MFCYGGSQTYSVGENPFRVLLGFNTVSDIPTVNNDVISLASGSKNGLQVLILVILVRLLTFIIQHSIFITTSIGNISNG